MGRFDFENISKSVVRLLSRARKKCESGLLFNTKMPEALRVGVYVIVKMIKIKSMLILLITSML